MGMDQSVRVMQRATKAPLSSVIRMASLTPAKIAGFDKDLGSIAVGKVADFVLLDSHLKVSKVFLKGELAIGN